jgi:ParB family chromosome partitioning protein
VSRSPSQSSVPGFGLEDAEVRHVPLDLLSLDDTTFMNRLAPRPEKLVDSVRANGVLIPLIARPHPTRTGRLQLVCGFTRAHAARIAPLETVPVIVRELTDVMAHVLSYAENEHRSKLAPLDRAHAIDKLRRMGMTTAGIASALRLQARQVQVLEGLLAYPIELRRALADDESGIGVTHALVLMQALRKYGAALHLDVWLGYQRDNRFGVQRLKAAISEDLRASRRPGPVIQRKPNHVVIDLKALKAASEAVRRAAREEFVRIFTDPER